MLETQKSVEIEYDKQTNKPKQIISNMAPQVLQKLIDSGLVYPKPEAGLPDHLCRTCALIVHVYGEYSLTRIGKARR